MRRAIASLALCATLLAGCTPASMDAPDPGVTRMHGVSSWAFAIGDGCLEGSSADVSSRLSAYDMVVVDAEEADADTVSSLRGTGTLVIGYLSVGTVEPWRSWYPKVEAYRLEPLEDWDEYYADLSAPGYRDAILSIGQDMLDKGFDGLFLDNLDVAENHPGFERGLAQTLSSFSELVHARDGVLLAQNGWGVLRPLAGELDGWNREDVTWTYDFDAEEYRRTGATEHRAAMEELTDARRSGLLTLSTDYTDGSPAAQAECRTAAHSNGALPFVSDIGLTRLDPPDATRGSVD